MSQIILKKRTAHLASYTFLQEMIINIKTRLFHSCINHQEDLFLRKPVTSYFRPVNIAKFLRTAFFTEHLRWLLLHFYKKVIKQLFRNLAMTY